ncbi:DUF6261 family protein [Ancylomarina sp. 16SWW S1-10-2]|uniref:DUF6261 family protein n=1 Tax=Ancylomarina sp. 16SWW S1-10-2 TaxID=2499681 RepID=UPI0012AD828A|nr:DUF6261 family protein [Ancylomarina sp. 16SWW S1-10-2]MRT94148.1 hypothetical protein [Ancylomarina sp. 16SWW S1-10-2]
MVLIKKITPSSRNGDISALLTLILKAFAKNDWSADLYLTPLINSANATNTLMIEALKRLKAYSQMAEKDHDRDMAIRALFKLIEGYTYIPIVDMQNAAVLVENVLAQYGLSIQNEDYAEESANVESLLNDLIKPNVVAAAALLQGVPETITILTTAQQDFENLALQQAEDEGVKNDLASASKLKKEAIVEINTSLVGYLNTMAKVNPATYADIAHTIAELIDTNNELVKRRRTTNEPDTEVV